MKRNNDFCLKLLIIAVSRHKKRNFQRYATEVVVHVRDFKNFLQRLQRRRCPQIFLFVEKKFFSCRAQVLKIEILKMKKYPVLNVILPTQNVPYEHNLVYLFRLFPATVFCIVLSHRDVRLIA